MSKKARCHFRFHSSPLMALLLQFLNMTSLIGTSVSASAPPAAVSAESSRSSSLSSSAPRIVEHPDDQFVLRNEPATLNCRAVGEPPPMITWYRNGGERVATAEDNPTSHRMVLPGGQLFFLRVMHAGKLAASSSTSATGTSDAGVYHCRATNPATGETAVSRNATLAIAALRDEFREEPQPSTEAGIGDTIVLPCRGPRGDPEPRIRWKKDGVDVMTSASGGTATRASMSDDGSSLTITDVHKEDSGVYVCLAQNIAGVRESRPSELRVTEKPRILHGPTDTVAHENGDVLFKCHATGDPEPAIIWKKRKGLISAQRSRILDDRSLRIKKVKASDEGVYVCRVENKLGWQEAEARLTVTAQPTFVTSPASKTVVAGRRVSFDCQATGLPPPGVYWKKERDDATILSEGDRIGRYSVSEGGTLLIERVIKEDGGDWVCQARSVAGSAYAKARLDVKESDTRPPPVIQHGPQNQTLPVGSTAMLRCVVVALTGGQGPSTAGPTGSGSSEAMPPIVRWLKDGHLLAADDKRFKVIDHGTLQITDLRKSDSGWYVCRATSETGETALGAALIVEPPTDPDVIFHRTPDPSTYPGQPSKPNVGDVRETSVRLTWKANPNNGASIVSGFTIEYFSHETGQGWTVAADNVIESWYTVRGLKPDTAYRFVVRARNSHGLSLPSAVTQVIRTKVSKEDKPVIKHPSIGEDDFMVAGSPAISTSHGVSSSSEIRLLPPDSMGPTRAWIRWVLRTATSSNNVAAASGGNKNGGEVNHVDGFRVKYRAMTDVEVVSLLKSVPQNVDQSSTSILTRPDTDRRHDNVDSVLDVMGSDQRSYELERLRPNTIYSVVIHPLYRKSVEGPASNVVYLQTSEDVPSAPPSNVQATMLVNGTIRLTWDAPAKDHYIGVLTGYKVYVRSNDTKFYRSYWLNATSTSPVDLLVPDVDKDAKHFIEVAAHNKMGEGPRSSAIQASQHDIQRGEQIESYEPWFVAVIIACVGSALWMGLCTVVMWIYRCRQRKQLKNSKDIDKTTYGITDYYNSVSGFNNRATINNKMAANVLLAPGRGTTRDVSSFLPVIKSDQLFRSEDDNCRSTADSTADSDDIRKDYSSKLEKFSESFYSNNDDCSSGGRVYDEPDSYGYRPTSLYRSTRVFLPINASTPQPKTSSSDEYNWNYTSPQSSGDRIPSDDQYGRCEPLVSVAPPTAGERGDERRLVRPQFATQSGARIPPGGGSMIRPGDYTLGPVRWNQQTQ